MVLHPYANMRMRLDMAWMAVALVVGVVAPLQVGGCVGGSGVEGQGTLCVPNCRAHQSLFAAGFMQCNHLLRVQPASTRPSASMLENWYLCT